MVARAVGFVIVAITAQMEKVEFVDESLALEKVDSAVDGDEVNFGTNSLGAFENLVDIEMLLGGIHDLEDHAALAGDANAALAKGGLEMARWFGGVNAFAGRDTAGWRGGHEADASNG